ncbi:MAG TPA: hypothetical protein VMF62_19780 [Acetobacteraceae bacterium]|nr:hypothetical protein [Acetobacteraceae bacterium]
MRDFAITAAPGEQRRAMPQAERRRPDRNPAPADPPETGADRCLILGDHHALGALAFYRGAGLTDQAIHERLAVLFTPHIAPPWPEPFRHDDAAWALARHAAAVDLPRGEIFDLLAYCLARLPAWPNDPEHLIAIVSNSECAQ